MSTIDDIAKDVTAGYIICLLMAPLVTLMVVPLLAGVLLGYFVYPGWYALCLIEIITGPIGFFGIRGVIRMSRD